MEVLWKTTGFILTCLGCIIIHCSSSREDDFVVPVFFRFAGIGSDLFIAIDSVISSFIHCTLPLLSLRIPASKDRSSSPAQLQVGLRGAPCAKVFLAQAKPPQVLVATSSLPTSNSSLKMLSRSLLASSSRVRSSPFPSP